MSIRLTNTLTRSKEEFIPLVPGQVGIYTCGPTVYDYAHIGNFRSYLFADILRRLFEYTGYKVTQVMNITDVGHLTSDADTGEDKLVAGARREKKTPWEIAEYYTQDFFKNSAKLNILNPQIICKATDHIPEMLALVQTLVDKGFGYETSDGIYFEVSKLPQYGQLSGIKLEEQKAGARVEVRDEKRHPADFALWKKVYPALKERSKIDAIPIPNLEGGARPSHIMQWDSPWGKGFPGWHLECSAMSMKYLGETFDIHTGGTDHIPIHHENEIAQSEAATGKQFVRYWLHGEFLQVDGGKMSKSKQNFYQLKDLEAKHFDPLAFRYFCLTGHYRSPLNFTWESIDSAQRGLTNLRQVLLRLQKMPDAGNPEPFKQKFLDAITDDLNMPNALAVVWDMVKELQGNRLRETLLDFDRVLGLRLDEVKEQELIIPAEIEELKTQRDTARKAKDYQTADILRQQAAELGYLFEDTPQGTIIKPKQRI
ncbi:MAG: cysteine--tRNA ligase [bacterium]|nr:cysteine--tRNA ligase [bacterium]